MSRGGVITAQDSPRKLEQGAKIINIQFYCRSRPGETEARYVDAIRDWLAELPDFQREKPGNIERRASCPA